MNTSNILLALILLSGIFLLVSLYKLHLPGYYYDEGYYALPAIDLVDPAGGKSPGTSPASRHFPVMNSSYCGATQIYLLVPFMKLMEESHIASRVMPVLFALLAIWLSWWLCEVLFNGTVAAITCLLLVLSPSFVFWSRVGLVNEGPLLLSLYLLVLIFLSKWYLHHKAYYLYTAALIAGFGVYSKLNFLIVVCGIVLTSLVFSQHIRHRLDSRKILVASGMFLIGISPLIIYNLNFRLPTADLLLNSMRNESLNGVDNLEFVRHLMIRAKHLASLVGGNIYDFAGNMVANPSAAAVFSLAAVYLFVRTSKKGALILDSERIKALMMLQGLIFLGNCFTVSNFTVTQLFYMITPLLMIMAVFLYEMLRSGNKKIATLSILILGAITFFNSRAVISGHAALEKTGGEGLWSDAVYSMADYLQENDINPKALDWGIKKSVQTVTRNRIAVEEMIKDFNAPPDRHFIERCKESIKSKDYFVIIAAPYAKSGQRMGYYDAFYRTVVDSNMKLRPVREFKDRSGRTIYMICTVD